MRKYFFTGIAILLPIVITVLVVVFFLNLLTNPFLGFVEEVLDYYALKGKSIWFLSGDQVLRLISKFIIIVFLFLITLAVGFLGRWVLIHYLFRIGDKIIHKIPIINKVYKAAKDVVTTLFSSEETQFKQVVLVPFPHSGVYSLGLITRGGQPEESFEKISVFVPASPNPSMGFMFLYQRKDLLFIDMKVEDALKMIISCGVVVKKLKCTSYS